MTFLNKIHKLFRKTNVKKQFIFIYFSLIVLPILLIGGTLIYNSYQLLLRHYQTLTESENTRVKSIMFDVTTTVYNISDEIFTDKYLQTLLSTRYPDNKAAYDSCRAYYEGLRDYITRNTFISSINIYTTNPTLIDYSSIKPVTKELSTADWFVEASKQIDCKWKSLPSIDSWGNDINELCLIRRIPVISTDEYAILVIKVSNNYLKNRIQNNSLNNTVTTNMDPVFFSTIRNQSARVLPINIDYAEKIYQLSGKLVYEEMNTIAHISTLLPYSSKDKFYILTMDFNAIPETTRIIFSFTAIILLGSLIPFSFYIVFTQRFSARIITLRSEMHKASAGNYNIIDNFKGNDELSEVFSDLKLMIHSIKEMDSEMYEARIKEQILKNQQQKMEFKMLTSQINPHFLYNTLESIRMKALVEGNPGVANAIMLLGKSMHYVLENNGVSSTSLDKELSYINTYLAIQKLRFSDRIIYTLHVQEKLNLQECQILPLLLQPVVENSISHGLSQVNYTGNITIDVKSPDKNQLLIIVQDNGIGMTEEELEQVRAKLQITNQKSSMNIGLNNINQRIKLFYGEAYGIEIHSHLNEGTRVTFSLPLHTKPEE